MRLHLKPSEVTDLRAALYDREMKLAALIDEWDKLPDDTIVNNLERFVVAKARDDIPRIKALIGRLSPT